MAHAYRASTVEGKTLTAFSTFETDTSSPGWALGYGTLPVSIVIVRDGI